MPSEKPTPESNEQLREEFNRLRHEQDVLMKRVVFIGMTADEAKEYEKLRNRLTELFETNVPTEGYSTRILPSA